MKNLGTFLGRLARAASGTAHRRGLAQAIGELLHRDLSAARVELIVPSESGDAEHVEVTWSPGSAVTEAVASSSIQVTTARPNVRRVHDQWEIRIALPMSPQRAGQLAITVRGDKAPSFAKDTELLVAIGCVVGMACHGCELVAKVAALSRRAHRENRILQQRLSELGADRPIVAVSRAMRDVVEQIELVAPHPTAVLIRGESGTGKELLARHLHRHSDRAQKAFIAVNCAALPEALIESELFGHEKGAFTGAVDRHIGRFERAHGGTLFLDEVGELPANAQAKLLRVLQERVVERVGGRQPIEVDVRMVAATHQPLETMLEAGKFRADLYYRLNVFPVDVPALRDRPEDIPELARAKLRQMCERLGREVPSLSRRQIRELCASSWPGNVRELENHLERALILSGDRTLQLPGRTGSQPASRSGPDPTDTLNDAVRRAITTALEQSAGKVYGADGAASKLGLKPSTLQSKMKKLRIRRSAFQR